MAKQETTPTTINFDVGGTVFKVSKSLLDRYPQSMLAAVASERWNADVAASQQTTKPIFLDRDGERFRFVLDYLRDLKVQLPLSVPKAQFCADLEYYGLDTVHENITLSVADPQDLFHTLGRFRDFFSEESGKIVQRFLEVEAERMACQIASAYFSQLTQEKAANNNDAKTYYFVPTKVRVA
ncbi:MAG: hypothetical protein SGARI_001418, partial [Bacillariaceae sp.]